MESNNPITYDEAVARHHQWASQFPGDPQTPSQRASEEYNGIWHLNNADGALAIVTQDGEVHGVREFWDVYERLSEEGKCDSPGGGEYRRVLMEWIEDKPDDLDEFIERRANAMPDDFISSQGDRVVSPTLHADGFVFKRNPSHIGGGYTVVDGHGNLVEREQILKSDFTNNEAELLAISRAVELSELGGIVITDSMTAKGWVERGRSRKRGDLIPLIRQCREQVLRKGVRVLYRRRNQNLAGIYNDEHRPEPTLE